MGNSPPKKRNRPGPVRDWHLWAAVGKTVDPLLKRSTADPRTMLDALNAPSGEPGAPPAPVGGKGGPPPRLRPPPLPSARAMVEASGNSRTQKPIEPGLKRRLARGHLPIDGTLDLHGMTQAQAHAALLRYLPARAARGDRTILVITGKGLKKTGYLQIAQKGVLRTMVPVWLAGPDLAPLVAGWEPAHQSHGGEGALYVRLGRGRAARP